MRNGYYDDMREFAADLPPDYLAARVAKLKGTLADAPGSMPVTDYMELFALEAILVARESAKTPSDPWTPEPVIDAPPAPKPPRGPAPIDSDVLSNLSALVEGQPTANLIMRRDHLTNRKSTLSLELTGLEIAELDLIERVILIRNE